MTRVIPGLIPGVLLFAPFLGVIVLVTSEMLQRCSASVDVQETCISYEAVQGTGKAGCDVDAVTRAVSVGTPLSQSPEPAVFCPFYPALAENFFFLASST